MSFPNTLGLSGHLCFSISCVGVEARKQLGRNQQGKVLAVFERSFYVKTGSGMFCLGLAELGRGPLNALMDSTQKCLPFIVTTGEYVRILNHRIMLGDNCVIDASKASISWCEENHRAPLPQRLQRNRNTLKTLRAMPQDGFFWLLGSQVSLAKESTLQAALRHSTSASLVCLSEWLQTGLAQSSLDVGSDCICAPAALGLLGAGPGLTPAGDDVIAGIMLALSRFQRPDMVELLWKVIEPSLSALTHSISAAHLEQAAKGFCGEAMNTVLNNIFHSKQVDSTALVQSLDNMGCTSGWDTIGGVVMVIDAWQNSLNTTHRTFTTC